MRCQSSKLSELDLERHSCGEFSYAVAQGYENIMDQSQVEIGSNAIFVGIYHGHSTPRASNYIKRNLFNHITRIARDHGTISEETLREAFSATEEGFLTVVQRAQEVESSIVVSGSCCLVGVIWKGTLRVAYLGDCYAVNGTNDPDRRCRPIQMMVSHNVNNRVFRQQVCDSNPDDPDVVVLRDGVWRIKDITPISRSIGDAYLKRSEFQVPPSLTGYQLPSSLRGPAVSAEPGLHSRDVGPTDRFFIFASRGFWRHINNVKAYDIVDDNPRSGIASRLVIFAQEEAARKANITYGDLLKMEKKDRKTIHEDMTVVVVFIDHDLVGQKDTTLEQISTKAFSDSVGQSNFSDIDDLM